MRVRILGASLSDCGAMGGSIREKLFSQMSCKRFGQAAALIALCRGLRFTDELDASFDAICRQNLSET